jgi:26S proteasome regulatory subunit N4
LPKFRSMLPGNLGWAMQGMPCSMACCTMAPCMQGFPRADIDVAAIRKDRNRHACLINDVNALMAQIAKGLEQVHALARAQGATGASAAPKPAEAPAAATSQPAGTSQPAAAPGIRAPTQQLLPFAVVDEVSEGSPAATAGVQVSRRLRQERHLT